jgi:hypothetical protein
VSSLPQLELSPSLHRDAVQVEDRPVDSDSQVAISTFTQQKASD